ncbi:hypothetical protein [Undibacterium sp. TC9W]|uniref:hypothetical protein n=1 Tax=Undibacterium sp. TC9W TaxID=3413053 RepID=UPI003BF42B48
MQSGIRIEKIELEVSTLQLKLSVGDGESQFCNSVYVDVSQLDSFLNKLNLFKTQIFGGILNFQLGEFGQEYARGAMSLRFHFREPSKIYISIKSQGSFEDFGTQKVANEAAFFLISEPVLLDNFIDDLKALIANEKNDAAFETIN